MSLELITFEMNSKSKQGTFKRAMKVGRILSTMLNTKRMDYIEKAQRGKGKGKRKKRGRNNVSASSVHISTYGFIKIMILKFLNVF